MKVAAKLVNVKGACRCSAFSARWCLNNFVACAISTLSDAITSTEEREKGEGEGNSERE